MAAHPTPNVRFVGEDAGLSTMDEVRYYDEEEAQLGKALSKLNSDKGYDAETGTVEELTKEELAARQKQKVEPEPPLFVWVDAKTGKPYTDNAWLNPKETVLESNEEYARRTWNANAHTKKLWKKLYPGAVDQTMALPEASQKGHFKWEPDKHDKKTWEWHLTRNQLRARTRHRPCTHAHAHTAHSRTTSPTHRKVHRLGQHGQPVKTNQQGARREVVAQRELLASFTTHPHPTTTHPTATTSRQHRLLWRALKTVDASFQNLDSSEISLTDVSHYFDSDPTKLAEKFSGKRVASYVADTTTANGQVRTLAETTRLDARTKLLNPKWYEGNLAAGYEGAREIQKRLQNTLGWSATSGQVVRACTNSLPSVSHAYMWADIFSFFSFSWGLRLSAG